MSTDHEQLDLCKCSYPQGDFGGFCADCGRAVPRGVQAYTGGVPIYKCQDDDKGWGGVRPGMTDPNEGWRGVIEVAPVEPIDRSRIDTAEGAATLFEEMKKIAIGFMNRTGDVEQQLTMIVSTVYVNLAKQRDLQGDEFARAMVTWMDVEIAKLNATKAKYLAGKVG